MQDSRLVVTIIFDATNLFKDLAKIVDNYPPIQYQPQLFTGALRGRQEPSNKVRKLLFYHFVFFFLGEKKFLKFVSIVLFLGRYLLFGDQLFESDFLPIFGRVC